MNINGTTDVSISINNESFDSIISDLAARIIAEDYDYVIQASHVIIYELRRYVKKLEHVKNLAMLAREHETEINN